MSNELIGFGFTVMVGTVISILSVRYLDKKRREV